MSVDSYHWRHRSGNDIRYPKILSQKSTVKKCPDWYRRLPAPALIRPMLTIAQGTFQALQSLDDNLMVFFFW